MKDDHHHSNHITDVDDSMRSPDLPKFKQFNDNFNGNHLHLPEEEKANSEPRQSVFKIDFANDPVLRSLLETKQDQCALTLQRMYLSKRCRCAYLVLALLCTILVLWTVIDSKAWKENALFIVLELLINVVIAIDIAFKIKLTGCKKYFKTCSNIFDFSVASGCIFLYLTIILMSAANSDYLIFQEIGDQLLFIIW